MNQKMPTRLSDLLPLDSKTKPEKAAAWKLSLQLFSFEGLDRLENELGVLGTAVQRFREQLLRDGLAHEAEEVRPWLAFLAQRKRALAVVRDLKRQLPVGEQDYDDGPPQPL